MSSNDDFSFFDDDGDDGLMGDDALIVLNDSPVENDDRHTVQSELTNMSKLDGDTEESSSDDGDEKKGSNHQSSQLNPNYSRGASDEADTAFFNALDNSFFSDTNTSGRRKALWTGALVSGVVSAVVWKFLGSKEIKVIFEKWGRSEQSQKNWSEFFSDISFAVNIAINTRSVVMGIDTIRDEIDAKYDGCSIAVVIIMALASIAGAFPNYDLTKLSIEESESSEGKALNAGVSKPVLSAVVATVNAFLNFRGTMKVYKLTCKQKNAKNAKQVRMQFLTALFEQLPDQKQTAELKQDLDLLSSGQLKKSAHPRFDWWAAHTLGFALPITYSLAFGLSAGKQLDAGESIPLVVLGSAMKALFLGMASTKMLQRALVACKDPILSITHASSIPRLLGNVMTAASLLVGLASITGAGHIVLENVLGGEGTADDSWSKITGGLAIGGMGVFGVNALDIGELFKSAMSGLISSCRSSGRLGCSRRRHVEVRHGEDAEQLTLKLMQKVALMSDHRVLKDLAENEEGKVVTRNADSSSSSSSSGDVENPFGDEKSKSGSSEASEEEVVLSAKGEAKFAQVQQIKAQQPNYAAFFVSRCQVPVSISKPKGRSLASQESSGALSVDGYGSADGDVLVGFGDSNPLSRPARSGACQWIKSWCCKPAELGGDETEDDDTVNTSFSAFGAE